MRAYKSFSIYGLGNGECVAQSACSLTPLGIIIPISPWREFMADCPCSALRGTAAKSMVAVHGFVMFSDETLSLRSSWVSYLTENKETILISAVTATVNNHVSGPLQYFSQPWSVLYLERSGVFPL